MKQGTSGIYRIVHIASGKQYIGSAINIHTRWFQHRQRLKHGEHHSHHLQNAWKKYGSNAFRFEIVELVLPERTLLLEREQHWLDKTRAGDKRYSYNTCTWAGSPRGVKASEETRKKLSRALKGKYVGTQSSGARLTEEKVSEIKRLLLQGESEQAVAKMFDVHGVTIHYIASGATWKHVPWPGIAPGEQVRLIGNHRTGLKASSSKLSSEQVTAIMTCLSKGETNTAIAKRFSVDIGTICFIRKGETYQDVPWPEDVPNEVLRRLRKDPPNAGSRNCHAKLTEDQVIAIKKELLAGISRIDLATRYNVTAQTISRIKAGKTWDHLASTDASPQSDV